MQIQIDNFFVALDEYNGTDGVRITIDQSDGARRTSVSGEITFYGTAKAYILDKLFFGANALTAYVTIQLFDECCKDANGAPLLLFTGKTTRGDISVAEEYGKSDCGVVCTIVDSSTLGEKVQCVRNTIIHATQSPDGAITSAGENEYRAAPFFLYYEETRPRTFTYITSYLLIIILTLYLPLISALRVLTLGFVGSTQFYRALLDLAFKAKIHKAPFIHSYLSNVCKLCGLTLQSSLFNPFQPLHNLTRLDAAFSEGGDTPFEAFRIWRDLNRPNITGAQLLESLSTLNIAYKVTPTALIVERKDVLTGGVWIDFIQRGDGDILELSYQTNDEAQPAGEIFTYSEDQSDKIGNEATKATSGAVVDYNTPFNPTLRGIRQTIVPYGASRFVGDERYTNQVSVLERLFNSGYFNLITLGNGAIETRAIISQTGVFTNPRLLMYDGSSQRTRALVESINGVPNGRTWLREDMQSTYNVPALYDLLLFINDPRRNLLKNLPFTIRFNYLCTDLQTIADARQIRFNFFGRGAVVGEINTIEIDLQNSEITVTGII